jgi:hypothetical protein
MRVWRWITVVGISLLATLALAVVLPRWNTGATATDGLTTFVDADSTNGYCNLPPDSSRNVPQSTSFDVAICVENPTSPLYGFDFELVYDDSIVRAPEVTTNAPMLDDNPDANQTALGGGWDCTGYGIAPPTGDVDPLTGSGHGRAKISCVSLIGPWTFTSTGYVAVVHFNALGIASTSDLALQSVYLTSAPSGGEMGSCNPDLDVPMPCVDGSVTVTGGAPPPTATKTPTITPTPTKTPTPTVTPTPRPFACLWEDDFGWGTSLGIRGDATGSWQFKQGSTVLASGSGSRPLATSRLVTGQFSGLRLFAMGRCPGGPARATALDTSAFPFRVLRLVDVSG